MCVCGGGGGGGVGRVIITAVKCWDWRGTTTAMMCVGGEGITTVVKCGDWSLVYPSEEL